VNRKGKKSPLTRVKNAKAKPKQTKSSKNKKTSISTKKKQIKSNEFKAKNSRLKHNLAKASNSDKSTTVVSSKGSLKPKKSQLSLWFVIYVIVVTIGVSTLLGTAISLSTSLQESTIESAPDHSKNVVAKSPSKTKLEQLFSIASFGKEINPLKLNLQELIKQYPDLQPGIFLVDLDTKGYVSIQGNQSIASASTIKLPILIAFFQDIDRGKIQLKEQLIMTKDVIGEGSGNMRYEKIGTKFTALETATRMMTVSDNTATNMLIKRMGGMEQLNQRFTKLRLSSTQLSNPLPDLTGTNTTSPEDLGNLLVKINRGELITLRSRDRLLHIMGNIVNDTLLPQGLDSEAIIAHKTGDIKTVLGDVGMIDMPNGKRYIASILVKRPENSPKAKELIQQVSPIESDKSR